MSALRIARSLVAFLLLCLASSSAAGFSTQDAKGVLTVLTPNYNLVIQKRGFRYSFARPDGESIVAPHATSGLDFGGGMAVDTVLRSQGKSSLSLDVTNERGEHATVEVELGDHYIRLTVTAPVTGRIVARTGGLAPAFGLADHAAFGRSTTDVSGYTDEHFRAQEPPGSKRLISNFVIFPRQGLAVVNMEKGTKIVRVTAEETAQGTVSARCMPALYYFIGTPSEIYAAYLRARNREGYPVYPPKYEFFGVGWEAFGALGWRTNEKTVTENVDQYLALGYPLQWMVVGSGFWPNEDPNLCATTSFGLWDKQRYPEPQRFIEHFRSRGLKFFLGLRISFIADGPYSAEGVAKGYFLTENGQAKTNKLGFPKRPAYLLDGSKPEAVKWYVGLCQKWRDYGVDGFKEDLFGYRVANMPEGNIDAVNRALMDQGVFIMGRNGYLGSAMDTHRIEDFNFDQNQDRGPINGLAFAYSAFPYVYPDITGGTFGEGRKMPPLTDPRMQNYMMRVAQFDSVQPSMAMGMGPWNFGSAQVEQVMLAAARLHEQLHPYIYSAAIDAYETGFPWTMAPLPLVFPGDQQVYGRENSTVRGYQWLLGPSLLACPLYGNDYATATNRDVYLPAGKWMDYDTGEVHTGPKLLARFPLPPGKTPLFVGGKGVLVLRDLKNRSLRAKVYPVAPPGSEYRFTYPDGVTRSRIVIAASKWDPNSLSVTDTTGHAPVACERESKSGALVFTLEQGHDYRVENRRSGIGANLMREAFGARCSRAFGHRNRQITPPSVETKYVFGKPASEERRSPTRREPATAAPRRVGDRRSSEAGLPKVYETKASVNVLSFSALTICDANGPSDSAANNPVSSPEPHRSLSVAPLIADKRCYGEATVRYRRGRHAAGWGGRRHFAARIPVAVSAQPGVLNFALSAKVTASSVLESRYEAKNAVDGVVSDDSRWLSRQDNTLKWLELDLGQPRRLRSAHVYSGWQDGAALRDFDLESWQEGAWRAIPGAKVTGNTSQSLAVSFTQEITAQRVRLTSADRGPVRLRELALFAADSVPLGTGVTIPANPLVSVVPTNQHVIALNQVGYNRGAPKRFTAPLSPDGSKFEVRKAGSDVALFSGSIRGHIGDFTGFQPTGPAQEYMVVVSGGTLQPNRSDPFAVGTNLWQEQFWRTAVDFMVDCRSVVGTHPSAYGGCPWRDGTYYAFEVPSLVLFYLADPERVKAMPVEMDWHKDKARVLAAGFKFDANNPNSEGVMEAVRRYYTELEPPRDGAPDVVQLIHWGLGYYLFHPETRDPSADPLPKQIHSQTVEQFAFLLYAWPRLKAWLPQSFHDRCEEFAFAHWRQAGLLEVDPLWDAKSYLTPEQIAGPNPTGGPLHPYKGRHAPGHSIQPNLLMYEVARRTGRGDADIYLKAAQTQAQWLIDHLDWNDPRTTKGQRMSEFKTMTSLVWFLQHYPKEAPASLKQKITDWARVMIQRSDNMWDFRRYDLDKHWTIPTLNETGNLVGFTASALAASWVVDDPGMKSRLREIAFAQMDNVFGRNPKLAAAPHHPEKGFPLIERGWPLGQPDNTCARLETTRGSLSASPGTEMYPFNPNGKFRHPEGWVNYNAAWNVALAYVRWDELGNSGWTGK